MWLAEAARSCQPDQSFVTFLRLAIHRLIRLRVAERQKLSDVGTQLVRAFCSKSTAWQPRTEPRSGRHHRVALSTTRHDAPRHAPRTSHAPPLVSGPPRPCTVNSVFGRISQIFLILTPDSSSAREFIISLHRDRPRQSSRTRDRIFAADLKQNAI